VVTCTRSGTSRAGKNIAPRELGVPPFYQVCARWNAMNDPDPRQHARGTAQFAGWRARPSGQPPCTVIPPGVVTGLAKPFSVTSARSMFFPDRSVAHDKNVEGVFGCP